MEENLDLFCGSSFWDVNLTWNTDNPNLTPCFERTVLVWLPCIFLWLFSACDIYFISTSKMRDIPWNLKNIGKVAITFMLILFCVLDLCYALKKYADDLVIYPVNLYTPIIKFVSLVLCLVLTVTHQVQGITSSGLLFVFWFLVTVMGFPQFYNDLLLYISKGQEKHMVEFRLSYLLYYCLVVVLLVVNFFPDPPPQRSKIPKTDKPCPENGASFPSRITFSWFWNMVSLGYKRPLLLSDLWNLKYEDSAAQIVPKFYKHWDKLIQKRSRKSEFKATYNIKSSEASFKEKRKSRKPVSILIPLCKAFGPTFFVGSFYKLLMDVLQFVSPQVLSLLIAFVGSNEPAWKGYFYAAVLFIVASMKTLASSQHFINVLIVGFRIRSAVILAVYRKALKLSSSARKESTVGEIVNLMAVDAQRFADLTGHLTMLWSGPLQIGIALYFLWWELGPSVLAGLAVLIILIPVNGVILNKSKMLQIKQMKEKDERVKLMNEILSGMKVLKLYAWESSFESMVLKIRNKEIKQLKAAAYLNVLTHFLWSCAPFLVALTSFSVYVLSDENNVLDAQKAFVSLSLFNIIRFPLTMLPNVITNVIQSLVSIKRVNKFMNTEDLDPANVTHYDSEVDPIVIEKGHFSWGDGSTLSDINLRIKEGSLVAIVGAVGSGKSSLISAMLGEMDKTSGTVNTRGSVAYVPQVPWIQNATLQENIKFGKKLDQKFYSKVVNACALKQDFDMLPGGDHIEIGEKGINLSGGQKQRVSLARAVYFNADVYFLDDPLSAVDSHVGKHIFQNVIGRKGLLNNKTRLLVTHSITFLPEVDLIVVLKNGTISEIGTYSELVNSKGAFNDYLIQYSQDINPSDKVLNKKKRAYSRSESTTSSTSSLISNYYESTDERTEEIGEKLIETEKAETGGVKWGIYVHYFRSAGMKLAVLCLIFNILYQACSIGSNVWLSIWTSDNNIFVNGTQDTNKRDIYLGIYGLFGVGQASTVLVATALSNLGALRAGHILHNLLLNTILHVPTSFFDVTPLGRVMNRFSKEVDTLDNSLPFNLRVWTTCFFSVISTLVVICYSTPLYLTVIIPIGLIYYFVQRFYVATSRQLQRLESISRSPIYSHFSETLTGTTVIRAYNIQHRFIKESEDKVDFNQLCKYPSLIANRWLAIRLETIGNVIIFLSALFAVIGKNSISPGLVGLSITYALQVTQTLNMLVRATSELETNIVAVERIKEYEEVEQEAPWEIQPKLVESKWPEKGKIEFKDFKVRYRKGLDLVLKKVSFTIESKEKVGIVGRTGAGKSSLTLSLFRIIEAAEGSILIDGIDIAKLGLHTLRSQLTIIPQDPLLFSGSLRLNLDPFNIYKDEQLWESLEHAHLKDFVKSLPAGLQHDIAEGGDNLSVGQRQLLCLARALLRKTQVLVLDEATAAVDLETDELIQRTIRSQFSSCTVLTIAHRLNTILDSDRVLVLDNGTIAEFDSPNDLLKNRNSIFYKMCHDAGLA